MWNLMFLQITGGVVIGISAYLLAEQESFAELTRPTDQDSHYLMYGKWFLVVAGSLMLLGGLLGCCGGFKQSSTLLTLVRKLFIIFTYPHFYLQSYHTVFVSYLDSFLQLFC